VHYYSSTYVPPPLQIHLIIVSSLDDDAVHEPVDACSDNIHMVASFSRCSQGVNQISEVSLSQPVVLDASLGGFIYPVCRGLRVLHRDRIIRPLHAPRIGTLLFQNTDWTAQRTLRRQR
jgi:hypothetical protein